MQRQDCTAVVLSGGRGSRMGGCDKSALTIGGERFLDRMQRELCGFGELILSSNDPVMAEGTAFSAVPDHVAGQGPMGGIAASLEAAKFPHAFVTACDMPFFNGALVDFVLAAYNGEDALICRTQDGKVHPLCGIYAKTCLPAFLESLEKEHFKLIRLLEDLNCRILDIPGEYSRHFVNINTPQDLARARELE